MHETLLDLVARSALMRGTSEAAVEHLRRARLSLQTFAAGECVFRAGDKADAVYFLLSAKAGGDGRDVDPLVQIEFKPPSSRRPLRFERIVQGEIFGELELLEHGLLPRPVERTTSALALTPACVVPLPLSLMADLIAEDAILRARLIRIGSQRLWSALQQQHDKTQTFPDLLLADWLVELAADGGVAEGNRVRFARKIAQSDIATDLGVSRETISRRLNEWERSGLLRTGARSQHIEILDYQRVSRLASLRTNRSRAALHRTIDDIDAAIACGDLIRARNIGLDIMRYYPSSPELHHRTALAAARSGDVQGSVELLLRSGLPLNQSLGALEDAVHKARRNPFLPMDRIITDTFVDEGYGEDEPEPMHGRDDEGDARWERQLVEDLAALYARLHKEQAFDAIQKHDRATHVLASCQAYNRLFEATQGYYPGINAATMAMINGDMETGRQIANRIASSLQSATEEYWPLATLAEALLILEKDDTVRDVLTRARDARGADDGAKASTILQFRRLATVLDADVDMLVSALRPHNVAVISGHLFRGTELDASQQEAAEAKIRKAAEEIFAKHNIGFVYGALACGSDIILAETAVAFGAEFEAVLPFGTERFIETSVRIGDPLDEPRKWESRFRALLERTQGARTLTIIAPHDPADRDLDGYFFHGFRYAAGCALQRATMLQTACRLIVVSDDMEPDTIAGSNRAFRDWREIGRPFDLIPYPYHRRPRAKRQEVETSFRPIVCLWDAALDGKNSKGTLDEFFKRVGKGLDYIERIHRDGRRGCCLLANTTRDALKTALDVVKATRHAKHSLKIVCDFGLVLGRNLKLDKKLIGRLQSADDLPGFPADRVLCAEAYAAEAKLDLGDDISLAPVGRAEILPVADDGGRQPIRSRPSFPIYSVRWAKGPLSRGSIS